MKKKWRFNNDKCNIRAKPFSTGEFWFIWRSKRLQKFWSCFSIYFHQSILNAVLKRIRKPYICEGLLSFFKQDGFRSLRCRLRKPFSKGNLKLALPILKNLDFYSSISKRKSIAKIELLYNAKFSRYKICKKDIFATRCWRRQTLWALQRLPRHWFLLLMRSINRKLITNSSQFPIVDELKVA